MNWEKWDNLLYKAKKKAKFTSYVTSGYYGTTYSRGDEQEIKKHEQELVAEIAKKFKDAEIYKGWDFDNYYRLAVILANDTVYVYLLGYQRKLNTGNLIAPHEINLADKPMLVKVFNKDEVTLKFDESDRTYELVHRTGEILAHLLVSCDITVYKPTEILIAKILDP